MNWKSRIRSPSDLRQWQIGGPKAPKSCRSPVADPETRSEQPGWGTTQDFSQKWPCAANWKWMAAVSGVELRFRAIDAIESSHHSRQIQRDPVGPGSGGGDRARMAEGAAG